MPDMEKFRAADEWLRAKRKRLEVEYSGQYLLISATDLTVSAGKDYDSAYALYKKRYGPLPPDGWSFLGQQLNPLPA